MNKNRYSILMIAAGIIFLAILLKLIFDASYKSKLPQLPDFQDSSPLLKEQITQASKKAHRNPTSDNLGTLGMIYHSNTYYDNAVQCYKLAIRKNKSKWHWSYYLGYLNNELGETNSAIENFRSVIKEKSDVYMAWYYVGEGYQKLGESYKAEVAFQRLLNLQENNNPGKAGLRTDYFSLRAYAILKIAYIYMNSNRADLAEQTLKQFMEFHHTFGPAYRLLGNIYSQKGDSNLSKHYILRANDLANLNAPVDTLIDKLALISLSEPFLLKQIDAAQYIGYTDWALLVTNTALKKLPENKYLISKLIKLSLKADIKDQVLPFLEKHFELFKEDLNELKEVGDLLFEKGYNSQSMIYYNKASKLDPEDFEIQFSLATCYWYIGMKEEANTRISDLLKKYDNNVEALTKAVTFFIMMGDRENAVSNLNKLKRISALNPEALKLSGMIAQNDGNIQQAITLFESSFKIDPNDMSTVEYLGNILEYNKFWSKAVNHYRKALEYHPNEPVILEKLGSLLINCPDNKILDMKGGLEYSERAFINKESSLQIVMFSGRNLAKAYASLSDKRNAVLYMNIIIQMARNENAPADFVKELEAELKKYNSLK